MARCKYCCNAPIQSCVLMLREHNQPTYPSGVAEAPTAKLLHDLHITTILCTGHEDQSQKLFRCHHMRSQKHGFISNTFRHYATETRQFKHMISNMPA